MLTGNDRRKSDGLRRGGADEFFDGRDLDAAWERMRAFVADAVSEAGADGAVVAVDGSVGGTLSAAVAAAALGGDRVLGLSLADADADEARAVADDLGIEIASAPLGPLVDAFEDAAAPEIAADAGPRATANARERLRMACLYYAANAGDRLVLGAANRTDLLLGNVTKYGDGAADLFPLGDLYGTEVGALARRRGLSHRADADAATDSLDDVDAAPRTVDALLRRIVDRRQGVAAAAEAVGVERDVAETVASLYVDSLHKRDVPPTPGLGGDARGSGPYPLHLAAWSTGSPALGDGSR